jgi:hypothetical protein
MINTIQFSVNILSFLVCMGIRDVDFSKFINTAFLCVIPFNVLVLVIFMYLFLKESGEEGDDKSMLISTEIEKREMNEMHSKILINEGRYMFYFIWGANIMVE